MAAAVKKVTIKNFKKHPEDSRDSLEAKWRFLESEVMQILNSTNYESSLEKLYRTAEDLHRQKYSSLLFKLQVTIEKYLKEKQQVLKPQKRHDRILTKLNDFWLKFCSDITIIKNVFLHCDRSSKYFKYNTIQNLSLGLFNRIIIQSPSIRKAVLGEILDEIELDRDCNMINKKLLKSAIEMLNTLNVYEELFLDEFLRTSEIYYEVEATASIDLFHIRRYILDANLRIIAEQQRVDSYLLKQTEPILMNILHKELIENHYQKILTKGFDQLIDAKLYNELTLIYQLFQRISNGNKHLLDYFKKFIIKRGTVITKSEDDRNMIQDVLDFKDNLEVVIEKSFENRYDFHELVRVGFKNFLNICSTKSAKCLAKFLDVKLRSKDVCDNELEAILDKVIKLFKYVHGKDIFEAFYKKFLAKRLLLGKASNQDAENSIISKLKNECGAIFTSNMEGMFQDMNVSKTINLMFRQKFKNRFGAGTNGSVSEFGVCVLTNSYWPNYPNYAVNLPNDLYCYQQCFQKFYLANHSGRKLLWQPTLGHCLIRAFFDCGYKELQVSLFQAVVLLLFNSSDDIGFKEILENTGLDANELKRTLQSLACGKSQVLLKNSKGKEIEDDDVFTFNRQFSDKLYRVRINQVQLQESAEEEQQTEKHVLVDRQFQIDAAIVRVMKKNKSIKHSALVKELLDMLDIPVTQAELKKRIELLIERDYMQRDEENTSTYIYIA